MMVVEIKIVNFEDAPLISISNCIYNKVDICEMRLFFLGVIKIF